jgi:hypothetical protein
VHSTGEKEGTKKVVNPFAERAIIDVTDSSIDNRLADALHSLPRRSADSHLKSNPETKKEDHRIEVTCKSSVDHPETEDIDTPAFVVCGS